jgi:predicted amidohydrolase
MEGTIGTLRSGVEADVTVLNDERGRWVLQDNEKTQVVTDRMLTSARSTFPTPTSTACSPPPTWPT